jgi:hypothetical protein
MENIVIEASTQLGTYPYVCINTAEGKVDIEGWYYGYQDVSERHFEPFTLWLESYYQKPKPNLTINFKLTYINTLCSRLLFDTIKAIVSKIRQKSGTLVINWYYDADTIEHAELFQSALKFKFNLLPFPEKGA